MTVSVNMTNVLTVCFCVFKDDFDPVIIADKLRAVADTLNKDPNFKKALDELKKTAATEVNL